MSNRFVEMAIMLMNAVPIKPNKDFPIFVSHPFTDSVVAMVKGDDGKPQMIDITESKENKQKFFKQVRENIERFETFERIVCYVNKPYRMIYLKLCRPFLTNEEFSRNLAEVWVGVENPNDDVNVPLEEVATWFRTANKRALMTDEDYAVYDAIPAEMDVFRGVSSRRNPKGFSWTRNKAVAEKFANRFGDGYILKAHVKKENVYAYFNTRGEDEYVVNTFELDSIERLE